MAAQLAIDVHGLTKRFGHKTAVDHVDIAVPAGEVWGFLGPNGSGKTTTIRMLCGLLKPDEGSGTCLGHDIVRDSDAIKRQVGYMTQKFSFWGDLTVRENLAFVARVYEVEDRDEAVRKALVDFGLMGRAGQLAAELSGGWKQRLALAACMLHSPRLLLLDEPTAGVDPQARREFWEQIHLLSDRGLTVLVSTHYMDEAERCDRIVYISFSKIVARGTVTDVIRASGLATFVVRGEGARRLLAELDKNPAVESVAFFGAALHVSGPNRAALERALAPFRGEGFRIDEVEPSLEDAFIALQAKGGRA